MLHRLTWLLTLATAASAFAAPPSPTDAHHDLDADTPAAVVHSRLLHTRNQHRIQGGPVRAGVTSQDVGNIAVLVDDGSIVTPAKAAVPFDLPEHTTVAFAPTATGFTVTKPAAQWDATYGAMLPLGDDTSVQLSLPFAFPFLGATHTSVWVNANGNLTFGSADSPASYTWAASLLAGAPRIAPLFDDLDVERAGVILASVRPNELVVTWINVPEYLYLTLNTFQVVLRADGSIQFNYYSVQAVEGAIGVAAGGGQEPFNEIDFLHDLPATRAAGAIFEEFTPATGDVVDHLQLAKEFYRTHPDHYDSLVFFTNFPADLGAGIIAYHLPIQNQTRGIGKPIVDRTDWIGPIDELESLIHMNDLGLYWPDAPQMVDPPIDRFPYGYGASLAGPPGQTWFTSTRQRRFGTEPGGGVFGFGLHSAMSLLAHEVSHRWLANVRFVHPVTGVGADSASLVDGTSHWSFFANTRVPSAQFAGDPRSSANGGNAFVQWGTASWCPASSNTYFYSEPDELQDGHSPLDQYLMGLRAPNEVGPIRYIGQPYVGNTPAPSWMYSMNPTNSIAFCGNRVDLTIDNIIAHPEMGPRIPAFGDEIDHDAAGNPVADVKTIAFVLLVKAGTQAFPAASVTKLDTLRTTFESYFAGPATGGRARIDTRLAPAVH